MPQSLDPTASWPRHLQASWRECAERGEVDGDNPPESLIDAYLLVAEVRTKRLSGIPWGDGTRDLGDDEESLLTDMTPTRTTCGRCGARELEHFYTSKRNGKTLCSDCFQYRVKRRMARRGASAAP